MLVFHPALAPYRIDFFNALAAAFNAEFYFSYDNLKDQKFDQRQLRSQCRFEFYLLNKGWEIKGRPIRMGIFKLLRSKKPEIVITSEYSQITLLVLMLKLAFRLKFKHYIISDDSVHLSVKRTGVRKWFRDTLSHYIDGIVFPSESVCDWYHQNVNAKTRLFSLPIVHENNIFRAKLKNSLPIAAKRHSKYRLQNKKIFLFVGRLVKIKNVCFLIHAFAASLAKMPDALLVIIGEGEEDKNLCNLAKELELVSKCLFLGRLEGEELYAWFSIADCFVLPSYQEPYGAVVNEALLAGCKVLCSKLAGAFELITTHNGAIFDPFNLDELCELLVLHYHGITVNYKHFEIKSDLMPFQLELKLTSLISFLKN